MKDIEAARAAVKEAQAWIDDVNEHGPNHFGELDEAYEAYYEAASTFFELYDEVTHA